MNVLALLRSKNRCLLKFHEASLQFLEDVKSSGVLPSLTAFELERENILKAISLFDRKITEAVGRVTSGERTPELIRSVEAELADKDKLLHQILLTDEIVLNLVEEEKNRIGKELNSSVKSRNLIQKFKSSWVSESGEEIDKNL